MQALESGTILGMALFVAALTVPDMIVLGIVAVLAIRGAIKGFTWQLIRTAGLVGAIWLAGKLNADVGAWISERFDWVPDNTECVVAWFVLMVGAWLLVTFIAHMARGAIKTVNLSGIDRVFGLGLGAVMGIVFATAIFVGYGHFVPNTDLEETLDQSVSAALMGKLIDVALPLVPEPVATEWSETFDEIREAGSNDDGE